MVVGGLGWPAALLQHHYPLRHLLYPPQLLVACDGERLAFIKCLCTCSLSYCDDTLVTDLSQVHEAQSSANMLQRPHNKLTVAKV